MIGVQALSWPFPADIVSLHIKLLTVEDIKVEFSVGHRLGLIVCVRHDPEKLDGLVYCSIYDIVILKVCDGEMLLHCYDEAL